MNNDYAQGNYVRAFNVAGAVVAASDTSELTAKDVAFNILELTKELAKGQDKYFAKEGFEGPSYYGKKGAPTGKPTSTYKGSSGSGGSSGGLTPKQRGALEKAFKALGEDAPYTMDQIEELSGKERSEAIGEVFSAAWGEQ